MKIDQRDIVNDLNLNKETEALRIALYEGKESAFVQLFNLYYKPLWSYANRIVYDSETANDLVQDVFCRLYENRLNLNISTSVKSYLYRSVYNASVNSLRRKKIEQQYIDEELLDFYFTKIIQTPEAEIILREEIVAKALNDSIQKLPKRCREIILLSKDESLSNRKIAERLNISEKTVEAQKTIAFSRLRKELEWLLILLSIIKF